MKHRLLLLIFSLIFSSCADESITSEFVGIETQQIDSTEYDLIKSEFSYFDVRRASEYLGGLSPEFKFAYTFALCGNDSINYCRDSEWANKGMMCGCKNLVVKNTEGFSTISSRSEFKEVFAPIESRGEALSYAIAMSGNFPVFDKEYFKDEYRYYNGIPGTTVVQEFDDYYLVQLFDYKAFGCDHPYYSVLIRVDKDGNISEHRRKAVFEDPEDDGLCRD
ncbi:hypothetical protein [Pontibacter populi]|uniref:Lipoprotein n=1 Tax=Pontibacter populi TaxID=890055 RepID=A0ABV1RS58_9BACT